MEPLDIALVGVNGSANEKGNPKRKLILKDTPQKLKDTPGYVPADEAETYNEKVKRRKKNRNSYGNNARTKDIIAMYNNARTKQDIAKSNIPVPSKTLQSPTKRQMQPAPIKAL